MGNRDQPADRSDIRDSSLPPLAHLRKHGERRVQHAPEHNRHRPLEIPDGRIFHGSDQNFSRVVHQDVDLTVVVAHSLHHVGDLLCVRNIALAGKHRGTALAQQGLSLRQLIAISRANGQTAIEARELKSQSEAEPTGSTGDQDRLAANVGALAQSMGKERSGNSNASGSGKFPK
jgi:hypothetical protein